MIQVPAVVTMGEHTGVNTGPEVYGVTFVFEDGSWLIDSFPEYSGG
jgi:hypothetical protein